jgi:hypothetical protein
MSALATGCSSEGEASVNADEGLDEAAIIIAAPARAARTPPGTRRETMVSSISPNAGR